MDRGEWLAPPLHGWPQFVPYTTVRRRTKAPAHRGVLPVWLKALPYAASARDGLAASSACI